MSWARYSMLEGALTLCAVSFIGVVYSDYSPSTLGYHLIGWACGRIAAGAWLELTR